MYVSSPYRKELSCKKSRKSLEPSLLDFRSERTQNPSPPTYQDPRNYTDFMAPSATALFSESLPKHIVKIIIRQEIMIKCITKIHHSNITMINKSGSRTPSLVFIEPRKGNENRPHLVPEIVKDKIR